MKTVIPVLTLSLMVPSVFAGDIATERTQAATGVIVAKIQQISDTISEAETAIKDFENLAQKTLGNLLSTSGVTIPRRRRIRDSS